MSKTSQDEHYFIEFNIICVILVYMYKTRSIERCIQGMGSNYKPCGIYSMVLRLLQAYDLNHALKEAAKDLSVSINNDFSKKKV